MKLTRVPLLVAVLALLISLNANAMIRDEYVSDIVRFTPATEEKNEDRSLDYRWVWISDDVCVRFQMAESGNTLWMAERFEYGMMDYWKEPDSSKPKTRGTYTGTWSQDGSGIWSFVFDDLTIPVGLTKIDGVLYAFTGYGELKEGYEYWNGQKIGADGVVAEGSQEFLTYLEAQYLPECVTRSAG